MASPASSLRGRHAAPTRRSVRRLTRPRPWTVAGTAVLAVCTWLLLVQWGVRPLAETGTATAARGVLVALVVVLPGIRVVMGPHRPATTVIGCGGVVLAGSALVLDHLSTATRVSEAVCGLVLLAASGTAALTRTPRPKSGPSSAQRA